MSVEKLFNDRIAEIQRRLEGIEANIQRLANIELDMAKMAKRLSDFEPVRMVSRSDVADMHPDMYRKTINAVFMANGDPQMMTYSRFCELHTELYSSRELVAA